MVPDIIHCPGMVTVLMADTAADYFGQVPLDRFGDFLPGDAAFQDKDFAPGVGQQIAITFAPGGNRPDIDAQKAFSGMTTLLLCSCCSPAAGLAIC